MLAGRSPHNVTVHAPIPAGKTIDELEGTIVKVRIDESLTWYLSGEVVDAEQQQSTRFGPRTRNRIVGPTASGKPMSPRKSPYRVNGEVSG